MNTIDFKFIIKLSIYSLILGGICAILSLIPFFMPFFSLFFIPFLGAFIPLILLIKNEKFYSEENKTYSILGAISGLCMCISYIAILVPFVLIFHLISKSYYDYGIQYLNFFLFILFFIMIALVYMTTNAVCGLIVGFIHKYIKGNQNGQNNRMD